MVAMSTAKLGAVNSNRFKCATGSLKDLQPGESLGICRLRCTRQRDGGLSFMQNETCVFSDIILCKTQKKIPAEADKRMALW